MCLQLTVRLSDIDSRRATEIAEKATAAGGLPVTSCRSFFRRRSPELTIAEKPRDCGCSLLAEDAHWDAPTWSMRPEVLPRLATTLAALRHQTTDGFSFEALWGGDDVYHEKRVSPEEMRSVIESGQISTDSRYFII